MSTKLQKIVLLIFLAIVCRAQNQERTTTPLSSHLSILDIELGKTKLDEVQVRLGKAPIATCGPHEEEAPKCLCYRTNDDKPALVIFKSGFSGGWTATDEYTVIASGNGRSSGYSCSSTNIYRDDLRTAGGLKLGLTKTDVIALLGKPIETDRQGHWLFRKVSKQLMTAERRAKTPGAKSDSEKKYWDIQDTIRIRFLDSRVIQFDVQHFVTD